MKFIVLSLLILAGCVTTPVAPCPEIPKLSQGASQAGMDAHHLLLIDLYAICAARK